MLVESVPGLRSTIVSYVQQLPNIPEYEYRKPPYQDLHLLSEAIRVFVIRAFHPTLMVDKPIPDLEKILPPTLRVSLLDVIRNGQPEIIVPQTVAQMGQENNQVILEPARKRKSSVTNGHEYSWLNGLGLII
jgi:hypothetical protein